MKKLLLIFTILLSQVAHAQEDKTVTLVVSGQGKTQDEARQNALRSAIEQAFGTFISSKTELLNDSIIKDEIVSVTNGNIQKFEIISEAQLPDRNWTSSISAIVSINKLITYTEGKGFEAELKGSLFAMNIKKDELNKQNELKAIRNMCGVIKQIADNSFDWTINVSEPLKYTPSPYSRAREEKDLWEIPLSISIKTNQNFNTIPQLLYSTLSSLDYDVKSEVTEKSDKYFGNTKLLLNDGREVFPITISIADKTQNCFLLRSDSSVMEIIETINYFNKSILNFEIENGIAKKNLDNIQLNTMEYCGERNKYSLSLNQERFKLRIDDRFYIILAIWTLPTGGPPSRSVFVQSLFYLHPNDYLPLPYYSYSYAKYLKELSGKSDFSRGLSISDYTITYNDLQYRNLQETPFSFLNNKKFIKSIPFSTLGPVISFNKVINSSDPQIVINCSEIISLKYMSQIKSYKISRSAN
jgi:hypothetical protein